MSEALETDYDHVIGAVESRGSEEPKKTSMLTQ